MSEHAQRKHPYYEPHLAIREVSLPAGKEWLPAASGWVMALVAKGSGYCLHSQQRTELQTGALLVLAGHARAVVRASQLGEMHVRAFNVVPARLTGLMTWGEEDALRQGAAGAGAVRTFAAASTVAMRMRELSAGDGWSGLMFRLKLLELFAEVFAMEFKEAASLQDVSDARERLRTLLKNTPPGEVVEMSVESLARRTGCTSRHLSRIFRELTGMSFRDKCAEVRMARARELLATSNSKVVEVALESGYKSLSLFNLVFTRRFGTSPGRWREKHASSDAVALRAGPRTGWQSG
ncbi:MAG: helix-turn-helix transcriptional regulator [Verrucomicrobia bacterium]|nr:helix-turn-helix transcriptional regulator [Verrucomicrobiota bacterium]MDE3098316.1 helix-turn-helix transcriptional regulator [Verrucomicrobiota bacterium]